MGGARFLELMLNGEGYQSASEDDGEREEKGSHSRNHHQRCIRWQWIAGEQVCANENRRQKWKAANYRQNGERPSATEPLFHNVRVERDQIFFS
jgi:hypothetical protein